MLYETSIQRKMVYTWFYIIMCTRESPMLIYLEWSPLQLCLNEKQEKVCDSSHTDIPSILTEAKVNYIDVVAIVKGYGIRYRTVCYYMVVL